MKNKITELIGGLKNALEKGENLENAKQSFINAGYKKEDVEKASHQVHQAYSSTEQVQKHPEKQQPQKEQNKLPEQPKKSNKKLYIILAIISALILLAAGILGFFWEEISGLF